MPIVLLFFGIPFLVIGIRTLIKTMTANKEFKKNGIPVTARVHDSVLSSSRGMGMSKLRVNVAFDTKDNDKVITELEVIGHYHSRHSLRIGRKIDILYHKDNPKKVHIANSVHAYIASVISIIACLVFMIIGIIGMSRSI